MGAKRVISNLESAINNLCIDIIEKNDGAEIEKMDSLSKLVNSYSRLLERGKKVKTDRGTQEVNELVGKINRVGIIR
jgi:hypothetical protein